MTTKKTAEVVETSTTTKNVAGPETALPVATTGPAPGAAGDAPGAGAIGVTLGSVPGEVRPLVAGDVPPGGLGTQVTADREKELADMGVADLKELAADYEIAGRSSMGKDELVAAIKEFEGSARGRRHAELMGKHADELKAHAAEKEIEGRAALTSKLALTRAIVAKEFGEGLAPGHRPPLVPGAAASEEEEPKGPTARLFALIREGFDVYNDLNGHVKTPPILDWERRLGELETEMVAEES